MLTTNLVSRVSLEELEALESGGALPAQGKALRESGGMSRRQFMKVAGLSLGGGAMAVPIFSQRSQAVVPVLIFAAIGLFVLAREVWSPKEVMSGRMQLINRSNDEKQGAVSLKLLERVNLNLAFQGMSRYSVPARTIDTYEFSGPFSDRTGSFLLKGNTEVDEKDFSLRVS